MSHGGKSAGAFANTDARHTEVLEPNARPAGVCRVIRRTDAHRSGVKAVAFVMMVSLSTLCLSSCLSVSESIAIFGEEAISNGLISRGQAVMLAAAVQAAAEISEGPDPEQEYYIGRSVAATVLTKYEAYDAPDLNRYLNLLGQGLALHSARPEIYNGYRFFALDSDEVNAFATPGGHIFVTRGLLRFAKSEDELAAVLAHEIAHVTLRHGLASVKGSRLANLVSDVAVEAGMSAGGEVAAFTAAFGDAISEIATTLIVSGYSQAYEFEADRAATYILKSAGYDPGALARVLERMEPSIREGDAGFGATHPSPDTRIEALASSVKEGKAAASSRMPGVPGIPAGHPAGVSNRDFSGAESDVTASFEPTLPIAPLHMIRSERFEAAGAYF